jgi:hypothetical protein
MLTFLIGVLEDYLKQFNYNPRAFPKTRLWLCIHTLAAIERLATPAVENPTDTTTSQWRSNVDPAYLH